MADGKTTPDDRRGASFVHTGADIVDATLDCRIPAPPAPEPRAASSRGARPESPVVRAARFMAMVGFNLVPLWGVLARGWSALAIVLLYWAENVIVGVFNFAKLKLILGHEPQRAPRQRRPSPWQPDVEGIEDPAWCFAYNYGLACFIHGFLLALVLLFLAMSRGPRVPWDEVGFGVLALFANHLASFVFGFIRPREHLRRDLVEQIEEPYPRIVVITVTITLGGFLAGVTSLSPTVLPAVVGIKIAVELGFALFQRA